MSNFHFVTHAILISMLAVLLKKYIDLKYTLEDMKLDCYPHPILSQPHTDAAKLKEMDVEFSKKSEEAILESSSGSMGIDRLGATEYNGFDNAEQIYLTGTEFVQKEGTRLDQKQLTESQSNEKYKTSQPSSEGDSQRNESVDKKAESASLKSVAVSVTNEEFKTDLSINAEKVFLSESSLFDLDSNKMLEDQNNNNNTTDFLEKNTDPKKGGVETSVWCQGSAYEDRICHFHNLCFYPLANNFVFFHGNMSHLDNYQVGVTNRPLVQLSSPANYSGHDMFLADFTSESAAQFEIKWIEQTSLIFNRFKPDNIMHVLHDDILPLHFTLDYLHSGIYLPNSPYNVQLVFMEGWEPGDYVELYSMFTDHPPIYKDELNNTEMTCFRNAFVGLSKLTTWYHYGYFEPQGPLKKTGATGYQIHRTVEYILSHLKLENDYPYASTEYIVLLSRKESRRILNEVELMLTLSRELGKKVVILSFETHSLKEMIHHIRNSLGVVGMHGSLLSLTAFLKPGSIVVELFPYAVNPGKYTPFKTLADLPAMDLVYRSWQNQNKDKSKGHPNYPPEMGGLGSLSMSMQKEIMEQTEVPEHLCCEDPSWLYHIYQDTEVDVSAVVELTRSALDKAESVKMAAEKYQLFPEPVGKVTCTEIEEADDDRDDRTGVQKAKIVRSFQLKWSPPSNMQDLRYKYFHYEVKHVREDGRGNGVFLVKETKMILSKGQNIKIWIRAVLDDKRTGPYSFVLCEDSDPS